MPSEEYFQSKFDEMRQLLEERLSAADYINVFNSIKNVTSGKIPNVDAVLWGQKYTIIDFSFLNKYLDIIHYWVKGVMFVLLALYNYRQLYRLIRGNDYIPSSNKSEGNEGSNMFGGYKIG